MQTIMFSGKQGSGKTTTARALKVALEAAGKKVSTGRFAQVIYEMHDSCLSTLKQYGIERDIKKDGPLLQLLGTDWGRDTIADDIWVRCLDNVRRKAIDEGADFFIVEDLRFKNEFDGIDMTLGPLLRVRLECPEDTRIVRCEMWRPNSDHPSEIDLDEYAGIERSPWRRFLMSLWLAEAPANRFDLTYDTSALTTSGIVAEILDEVTL